MIEEQKDGISFKIKVITKAKNTALAGWQEDKLKVRVAAVPEKGKANAELIAFLAKLFGIPKTNITIKGSTSREKRIFITGIGKDIAEKLLKTPI